MTDEQKNTKEEFGSCCEGMPFAKMMQNMMEQQGECCGFDCSEMMQKMMANCCWPQEEQQETTEEAKETQTANQ